MSKGTIITLCIIGGIVGLVLLVGAIIILVRTITSPGCPNDDPDEPVDYKPIIYLYPTEKTEITVKLGKPNNLTVTYPIYKNEWVIIAQPNGTLIDTKTGRKLYSLYWEGKHSEPINLDEGFIVEGRRVVEFLEEKLAILGLNEKESEEFIIYWLPKLQENKYNYIRFADINEINKNMPLELSKEPDTMIRILMQYKALDKPIKVTEQELKQVNRVGFTVVEWGGTEIK